MQGPSSNDIRYDDDGKINDKFINTVLQLVLRSISPNNMGDTDNATLLSELVFAMYPNTVCALAVACYVG